MIRSVGDVEVREPVPGRVGSLPLGARSRDPLGDARPTQTRSGPPGGVDILALQRSVGNRAVARLLGRESGISRRRQAPARRQVMRAPPVFHAQPASLLPTGPALKPPDSGAEGFGAFEEWLAKPPATVDLQVDSKLNEAEVRAVRYALFRYQSLVEGNRIFNLVVHVPAAQPLYVRLEPVGGKIRAQVVGRRSPEEAKASGPESPEAPLASMKAKLSGIGFVSVEGRGRPDWTVAELGKALRAFEYLDAQERQALRGVALIRVGQIEARGRTGNAFAKFDDKKLPPELLVADRCFEQDDMVFAGTVARGIVPASVRTMIHESGHAVEGYLVRENITLPRLRAARESAALQGEITRLNSRNGELGTQLAALPKSTREQRPAKTDLEILAKQVGSLIDSLESGPGSFNQRLKGLDDVFIPAARAGIATIKDDSAKSFQTALQAIIGWLDDTRPLGRRLAEIEAMAVLADNVERDRIFNVSLTRSRREAAILSLADVNYSVTSYTKGVFEHERDKILKLDPTDQRVRPELNEKRAELSEASSELYAEGFSLMKTDPEFLKQHYPDLFQFYATSKHLAAPAAR